MLAQLQQKAARLGMKPRVYQQAMESLDLPRRYRTVIVPSSSFQLLTDESRAKQAMERFRAHLLPGGALAMPFMLCWKDGDPVQTEWKLMAEKQRPEDGA